MLNPEQFEQPAPKPPKVKVTREGRVFHGEKSIGHVIPKPSYLHSPGTPRYVAYDRTMREVGRHYKKAEAVDFLVNKWTGK